MSYQEENERRSVRTLRNAIINHSDVVIDEAAEITPKQMRFLVRHARAQRAKGGWFNWYVERGRLPLNPSARDLRMISHRRAL